MLIIHGIDLSALKEFADIEILIKHDGRAWAIEIYERWQRVRDIQVSEIPDEA